MLSEQGITVLLFNSYGSFCIRDVFNKYHPSGVPEVTYDLLSFTKMSRINLAEWKLYA